MDQIFDALSFLPTLDTPVPLMVEQLVDVLRFVDALVPDSEQVIEVPKIILENIPARRLVRDPQLAEQLVAVPTPLPCSRSCAAYGGPAGGSAADSHRPSVVLREYGQEHLVSAPWACGGSTGGGVAPPTPSGPPPTGIHRQARAGYKYWPRVKWTSL